MRKKLFKYLVVVVISVVVLSVSSALLYRKFLQYKRTQTSIIASSQGIDSLECAKIGGIHQWIHVRGENANNPILLWIHGGPGVAFIPLSASFQGPLEKHFTVVQWDQRGAGKTFASNDRERQRSTMTLHQMEQDTLEMVNFLRARFHREKIFVLGHSWGGVLGLWLAHEHPDLIYAYVGVGQLINMTQNRRVMYQDALSQARQHHKQDAVQDLEAVAPYPYPGMDYHKDLVVDGWSRRLLGPQKNTTDFFNAKRLLYDVVSSPEYSLRDDFAFLRGHRLSLSVIPPQLSDLDLTRLGSEFKTPIFFFEGRLDPDCRPSLIWDYIQMIRSPKKEFVWFEDSGHFPFYEQPQEFADQMSQRVLPLATLPSADVQDKTLTSVSPTSRLPRPAPTPQPSRTAFHQ